MIDCIISFLNYFPDDGSSITAETSNFFFFFQVQPYNRKYRSIGHRVWSMSLNILTELSVNLFNSAEPVSDSGAVLGAS